MGWALAVRGDHARVKVRELVRRAKDVGQARGLLAIAVVLDGALREEAAKAAS